MIKVHRSLAACWLLIGIASFWLGWQDSVILVWIASVYANIASEWSASEAADDRAVLAEVRALRKELKGLRDGWGRKD